METEIETEEGIGTGIETEVGVETDLETGVAIEDLDIVVAMREHDGLNVYSVFVHFNPPRTPEPTLLLVRRDDFFQPVGPILYLLGVGRMTQVGVCFEGNSSIAKLLGFFHSDLPELFLGEFSERQRDQWVFLTVSPEDRNRGCRRFEKLSKACQTSRLPGTAHAYVFDLFPDREPPTKSGEACELVLGRESDGQGHGPPLAEPPNDNSVRGDTTIYLLRDEFGHLISGPEDPSFVFWTLEPKAEDIKPENAS